MTSRAKTPQVAKPEAIGHRVDPSVKQMLDEIAVAWRMPKRTALETAIRDLHRAVFREHK